MIRSPVSHSARIARLGSAKRVSNTRVLTRLQSFLHLRRGAKQAWKRLGAVSVAALVALLCALTAAAGAAATPPARARAASSCAGAYAPPDGRNAALLDAATLCLMNQLRAAHGVRPLRFNHALARVAAGQATGMVRGHYFADRSISGQSAFTRIAASSYVPRLSSVRLMTAQNIGWGTGPDATPAGIVEAWMQSPPHRRIMLTAGYRDAGVGVSPSVPTALVSPWAGGTYAVEFGTRTRRRHRRHRSHAAHRGRRRHNG
jgi:uncharacterized protein YkwD